MRQPARLSALLLTTLSVVATADAAQGAMVERCRPSERNVQTVSAQIKGSAQAVTLVHGVCADRKDAMVRARDVLSWRPAGDQEPSLDSAKKAIFERLILTVRLEDGRRDAAGNDPNLKVTRCGEKLRRAVNREEYGAFICATPWLPASKLPPGPKTADIRLDWGFAGDGQDDHNSQELLGSPRV